MCATINLSERSRPYDGNPEISRILALLSYGEVTSYRPLYSGSNNIFLLTLSTNRRSIKAIYKPCSGEIPLWDFPIGTLYKREYAAYLLDQLLPWRLVPPTVLRDGPDGIGSMQWFIDARHDSSYLKLRASRPADLKKVALFDCIINNADRKGSHCMEAWDGRIWLVDHGLTFNESPKLRTVIWDFCGQPVPKQLINDIKTLKLKLNKKSYFTEELFSLLSPLELEALHHRIENLFHKPVFPGQGLYRSVPWPPY